MLFGIFIYVFINGIFSFLLIFFNVCWWYGIWWNCIWFFVNIFSGLWFGFWNVFVLDVCVLVILCVVWILLLNIIMMFLWWVFLLEVMWIVEI